ncbi:MAG: transposase [Caldilineaceae bacterium]|nr:transposase [Caldilineaceae bacterium]
MTRRSYDEATKAAAMAALLAGQRIGEVAAAYNIPASTLRSWKAQVDLSASLGQAGQYEIGDLLLAYLRKILATLAIQAEHFGDKTWLITQDADSLAVLHGVATDKAIRLIEALTRGEEATGQADHRG